MGGMPGMTGMTGKTDKTNMNHAMEAEGMAVGLLRYAYA
jgi:hypothetical protein